MEMILNSPDRQYLSVNGHNPQRVCDTCSTELLPQQEQLRTLLRTRNRYRPVYYVLKRFLILSL